MKNLNLTIILGVILIFSIASCTNENVGLNDNNVEQHVTTITRKNYNPTTNELLSTVKYIISNNKILNSISTNNQNSQHANSTYTYLQNNLIQITNSSNSVLTSNQYYIYNSNNKLIEYRTESYNSLGEIQLINKHSFNQIQDTIYYEWTRKNSSNTPFNTISNSKIVIDNNKNRTFFENYDNINNEFSRVINEYDINNNIINEKHYLMNPDGVYVIDFVNSASYNNSINTLAFVINNTFGRETLMKLYPQSGSINEINIKSYSPNAINSYTTTWGGDGAITFNLTNSINNNNFCTSNTYRTYNLNTEITRFTYEYEFN